MEHVGIIGVENQQPAMFRTLELRYIIDFAVSNECMKEKVCQDQLRSLWTAYCLHHNLDADTCVYDNDLLSLWSKMQESGRGDVWVSYEEFDLFMGALLC